MAVPPNFRTVAARGATVRWSSRLTAELESAEVSETGADEFADLGKEFIKRAFLDNLLYMQGKTPGIATPNDFYQALAYTIRDSMLQKWISTTATYEEKSARTVAYLSAEFLLGPHLGNNLINLGLYDQVEIQLQQGKQHTITTSGGVGVPLVNFGGGYATGTSGSQQTACQGSEPNRM